ncbi:PAS domain S-box-containing protein [Halorubrum alkaliphilum]|uniref:histidine kinase n=1 Tax=Halorubrum alkaliphilum TaxID=261290 RepID=A0A8T4GIR8_9EURY|nr:histidine kinase N-terminal 7TM domain-containing protein [Halorubrum alkaliphilum]MBP1923587.1 PAS domain S-box-containing protein [Halorubrum alkaliphilum]
MVSDIVPAWPAVGSIAGGVGAIGLAWAIREHRGRPGVNWFLGVFVAQIVWCLSYGIGLLVTDPTLRVVLETTMWLGIVWTGIAFVGFALEYTGRSDVVRSRIFATIVGFGVLSTAVLVTNPIHGAFWTGFGLDPVFGVSTVSYALGPWAYFVVAVETVLVASAVFLLVDTLLSYGPLYRRESAAVALSSLPPGLALVAWTLELGPVPQLQLAPLMFVPHVLLDAYAFNRAEMFDRNPTTSRAAERTAIDDLTDPVVALALDERVVRLNPAAESLLGVDAATARDRPLDAFLDVTVAADDESADGTDELTVGTGGRRRTYAVATSPLTDPNGTHVGYTVVLSDVTERERRRQQLEVLNRILRHNLRNDAGVVAGYGELLVERLDDPELLRMADAIDRRAGALAALGEKAGTVETLLSDADPEPVAVDELVQSVVADARERDPDTTVELSIVGDEEATADAGDTDWTAELRSDALRAVVENTVENALEHHDGEGTEREDGGSWVYVSLRWEGVDDGDAGDAAVDDAGERFVFTVADDGPGIPDHEVNAIESGRETALEHGSGLGMWVVEWGADALGADVEYVDRDPRGTLVTVRIPIEPGRDGSGGEPDPDDRSG